MKLDKFNSLKKKFEDNAFENNFLTLDRILYWFSFLGNLFSIVFSYFFVKTVTDTIPQLFPGQALVFSIFIIVFMTGYEFLKRFTFEQVVVYYFKLKKFTAAFAAGILLAILLVVGSFYLSLNGSHRVIDQTEQVNQYVDTTVQQQVDSLNTIYVAKIQNYQSLVDQLNSNAVNGRLRAKDKADIRAYESKMNDLQNELDAKKLAIETRFKVKAQDKLSRSESNTMALVILITFMEVIILLGVGFNGYYTITSYTDMKSLLTTPKYKTMQTNLQLLHLYYQKGNKKEGDQTLSASKLKALASNQKLDIRTKDVDEFVTLCTELGIINVGNNKRKYYVASYDKAKELMSNQL